MLESMRRYKADIFQALAHPTRIAILECLNREELSVGQLCEKVGVEQANASQHLAVLRNKRIVQTRKAGNQIFYSLRDPAFGKVLDALREFFLAHMTEALELLRQAEAEAEEAGSKSPKPKARPASKR